MRHHHYANTTAQQQPRRVMDRQQQQSSGSGDYQPRTTDLSARGAYGTQQQADAPARRGLSLVAGRSSVQAG